MCKSIHFTVARWLLVAWEKEGCRRGDSISILLMSKCSIYMGFKRASTNVGLTCRIFNKNLAKYRAICNNRQMLLEMTIAKAQCH